MKIIQLILFSSLIILFSCNDEVKKEKTKNNQEDIKKSNKGWKEIVSKKGKFRIEFPAFEIEEGYDIQRFDKEEDTVYYYRIDTQHKNDHNLSYGISYMNFPNIITKDQIDKHFDYQRDMMLNSLNAVLEVEYSIDSLDYPGRELLVRLDYANIKMRQRIFHYNDITYKITVMTEYNKLFNKSISRFLESFEIIKD